MIRSFSVVVPVLNKENEIVRTLASIEASIAFLYRHYSATEVDSEVLIVDEGSSDRTLERVAEFCQDKPNYRLVQHFRSLGIGPARNTGAKLGRGDILFFCDGDDLIFEEHIYLCFKILSHQPAGEAKPAQFVVNTGSESFTVQLPPYPVGVVRTQVKMQEPIHPEWKVAIENTLALNLCIRRDCHEFIEGFPEHAVYKQAGCEDVAYILWVQKFFKIFHFPRETVEYIRYPGNNFDRQLKKFKTPPQEYQDDRSPEEKHLLKIRKQIEQERFNYLLDKFQRIEKTEAFLAVLNWQQLASEYFNQNNLATAIDLFERGVSLEPDLLETVKKPMAAIYNNLGSSCYQEKQFAEAIAYLNRALQVKPGFSPAEMARIYYNLGTALREQGRLEEAYGFLKQATTLDPTFQEAVTECLKLQYQVQLVQRNYQFTQDWFSNNLPVWQSYLQPFIGTPGLKVLEIGSWEGRSTCWLIDNILTHASARITCIDTFAGGVENQVAFQAGYLETIEQRFDFNIACTGHPEKVRKIVGRSQEILRTLLLDSYHLVYIDGSHIAADVLEDTLLTWGLVKIGGVIIFDDYGFQFPSNIQENPPRVAIEAFLTMFAKKLKLIHQGYQVIVEKTAI